MLALGIACCWLTVVATVRLLHARLDSVPLGTLNRSTNGYRLPTESELEYACRGETTTAFSFGENITTNQVNYNGDHPNKGGAKGAYRGKTLEVNAVKTGNGFGLYQMHGNVNEWCFDWEADYPAGSVTDPIGPESGSSRVIRGGGWNNGARLCRSANRSSHSPEDRYYDVGFRVAVGR